MLHISISLHFEFVNKISKHTEKNKYQQILIVRLITYASQLKTCRYIYTCRFNDSRLRSKM
jgi:hypothetical protein